MLLLPAPKSVIPIMTVPLLYCVLDRLKPESAACAWLERLLEDTRYANCEYCVFANSVPVVFAAVGLAEAGLVEVGLDVLR